MVIKKLTVLSIIGIFLLTACDKKVPQCSDSEVKKTVLNIFFMSKFITLLQKKCFQAGNVHIIQKKG